MSFFEFLFKELARNIEQVGQIEQQNQRILLGCCAYCGQKLPENNPSYHCQPDCRSHLAARYKEE